MVSLVRDYSREPQSIALIGPWPVVFRGPSPPSPPRLKTCRGGKSGFFRSFGPSGVLPLYFTACAAVSGGGGTVLGLGLGKEKRKKASISRPRSSSLSPNGVPATSAQQKKKMHTAQGTSICMLAVAIGSWVRVPNYPSDDGIPKVHYPTYLWKLKCLD